MEHPEEDDSVPLVVGVRVITHDRVNAGAYENQGRCIDMDLTKNEIIFNQVKVEAPMICFFFHIKLHWIFIQF